MDQGCVGCGTQLNVQVHHRDRTLPDDEIDKIDNLGTFCAECHAVLHLNKTMELPGHLQRAERDYDYLDGHLYRLVLSHGPISSQRLGEMVGVNYTTVKERLEKIMAADHELSSEYRIGKDRNNKKWGAATQIEPTRGHVPSRWRERYRAALDTFALLLSEETDWSDETIAEHLGVDDGKTLNRMITRAQAYQIPLEEVHRKL